MKKLTRAIELELEVQYQRRNIILRVSPSGLISVRLKHRKEWYSASIVDPFLTGLKAQLKKEGRNDN